MATVHANQILTIFMPLLGGHYHCVKVSSHSKMGLWEFSGALRELMLNVMSKLSLKIAMRYWETLFQCISKYFFLFLRKCQNKRGKGFENSLGVMIKVGIGKKITFVRWYLICLCLLSFFFFL